MTEPTIDATLTIHSDHATIDCAGAWNLSGMMDLTTKLSHMSWPAQQAIILNGANISTMDSAGAWLLRKCITQLQGEGKSATLQNFRLEHQSLLKITQNAQKKLNSEIEGQKKDTSDNEKRATVIERTLDEIGHETHTKYLQITNYLSLVGQISYSLARKIKNPDGFQWRSLMVFIDKTGFRALPIIALLSFLIGVVLTYQMGLQLQTYGANIFIVNLSGVAILREFAPLMTAIIVAGRTTSSFTAQIGMMKLNEEIDALLTMGLSSIDYLVLPRMIAVLITLPLLTVWSDIFGILGSMFMSQNMLGISYHDFLTRFQQVISINSYLIGIIKAPVFALIIASVGCFRGFQVTRNAASVGQQTTASVVQAIFLIIIVDAIFSVLFSMAGI